MAAELVEIAHLAKGSSQVFDGFHMLERRFQACGGRLHRLDRGLAGCFGSASCLLAGHPGDFGRLPQSLLLMAYRLQSVSMLVANPTRLLSELPESFSLLSSRLVGSVVCFSDIAAQLGFPTASLAVVARTLGLLTVLLGALSAFLCLSPESLGLRRVHGWTLFYVRHRNLIFWSAGRSNAPLSYDSLDV